MDYVDDATLKPPLRTDGGIVQIENQVELSIFNSDE